MPELELKIGGRDYTVACQDGEELHLQTAASALNAEAEIVVNAAGRIPESRMLLMAGLMLADKIAAVAEVERNAEEKVAAMEKRLKKAEKAAADAAMTLPLEAPEPPADDDVTDQMLARIATELEEIADSLEAAGAE